jgi:hypothetical protein
MAAAACSFADDERQRLLAQRMGSQTKSPARVPDAAAAFTVSKVCEG